MTGDTFALDRWRMLDEHLRQRGIRDQRVLDAMTAVPRERFVRREDMATAYADAALPIDCNQTISQPYVVAAMTEALRLKGDEKVLEIGTGSGYQTAVLAELAREVFTIERHGELSARARRILDELGYHDVHAFVGDGSEGLPSYAPFDRIIVTAAAERVPEPLWQQLAEGGLLVGPFGPPDFQTLQVIRKLSTGRQTINLFPCRFVPLVRESGEDESGG